MKNILTISLITAVLFACSSGTKTENKGEQKDSPQTNLMTDSSDYAPDEKGIGKFKDIPVDANVNEKMASLGSGIYDVKCSSCHKLTGEKLVGPGWKGVTSRRKAEWVMNFVTNTDEMLNKDPEAQSMLEVCLVRMPNQSLSDEDARNIYEFMRKNDGVK
jgi:hypothetical protein